MPRLEQARIDPMALGFAIAHRAGQQRRCAAWRPRCDCRAPRRAERPARRRARIDRRRCAIACAAALIVAEVALSLLLLVGAGLLIRSAIALQRTSTGFEPRGVLSARITLPATVYTEPARIVETLRRIDDAAAPSRASRLRRSRRMPRWAAAAAANGLVPEGTRADRGEPHPRARCASSRPTSSRRWACRSSRAATSTTAIAPMGSG